MGDIPKIYTCYHYHNLDIAILCLCLCWKCKGIYSVSFADVIWAVIGIVLTVLSLLSAFLLMNRVQKWLNKHWVKASTIIKQKRVCYISVWQTLFCLSLHIFLSYQPVHILCNLLVCDLDIDLRAGNRRVSHHFSNAFYRDACLQSQRAETVAKAMKKNHLGTLYFSRGALGYVPSPSKRKSERRDNHRGFLSK